MHKQKVFCCRLNAEYNNFFNSQHMNFDKIRQQNGFLFFWILSKMVSLAAIIVVALGKQEFL